MDFFPALNDEHRAFIVKQPVFFVATAAAEARINLSPKGIVPAERLAELATRTTSIDGLAVRVQTVLPAFDPPSQ